jgi:hypothetical protein
MRKVKKIVTILYIIIAITITTDLTLIYKFKFNFFSNAAENISGCNLILLNKKSGDMGNCFFTLGGSPLSNEVARLADKLSAHARTVCQPNSQNPTYNYFLQTNRFSVNKSNQHCLDSTITELFPSYAQNSLIQIASSTNAFDTFQCVGFVQTVISGIYGSPLNHGGDARDFISNVPTGYQYIDKTKSGAKIDSGDIALWDDGINGHIAIVLTRVDDSAESYRFKVAEANYQYPGYINNSRWETSDFPPFKGWLHKV